MRLQISVTLIARTYPMNYLIVKYFTNFDRKPVVINFN